jgi:hypothetical protein
VLNPFADFNGDIFFLFTKASKYFRVALFSGKLYDQSKAQSHTDEAVAAPSFVERNF